MDATETGKTRTAALIRLAIGLTQGLALFLLQKADESKAWPATQPLLYAPLLVCALMVPLLPLAALSAMRRAALIGWTLAATVLAAILAVHAAWTGVAPDRIGAGALSPPLFIAVAALLFIAHHLVQPAEAARRPVAPYADYFDLAWTNAVRLALSIAFTGAFWLLLFLAGALFKMIGVSAIEKLIGETAFAFPATGLMFAAAVHMAVQLTETRAGLVRGVRTVALTLLAWLLPLMTLIAAGFLATLPFTGLAPLWSTKAAAALLLTAAAALIVLINAAYQDGAEPPSAIPRWAARVAGLLLIPIVVLAAYALWLRVDQYGLTPDRVIAAAYLLVATGFTVGYAIAALRPGAWMKPLEPTNLIMAATAVLLLIALFTPIADPARLSVGDQVERLESGRVKAEAFDFQFLRFDSGRYGREALERLARSDDKNTADRAAAALKSKSPERQIAAHPNAGIRVYPKGVKLPDGFLEGTFGDVDALCATGCNALLIDVDGDGVDEVLFSNSDRLSVYQVDTSKTWRQIARTSALCDQDGLRPLLEKGEARMIPSTPHKDLEIGGYRLHLTPRNPTCKNTILEGGF